MRDNKKVGSQFFHNGVRASLKDIVELEVEDKQQEGFVTEREAVRLTGVSQPTLKRWRDAGKLQATKIGKVWLYSREGLAQTLQNRGRGRTKQA